MQIPTGIQQFSFSFSIFVRYLLLTDDEFIASSNQFRISFDRFKWILFFVVVFVLLLLRWIIIKKNSISQRHIQADAYQLRHGHRLHFLWAISSPLLSHFKLKRYYLWCHLSMSGPFFLCFVSPHLLSFLF